MILGEIEEAVDAAITEWANPAGAVNYSMEDIEDFQNLRSIVVRWLSQTETVREIRTLRYRLKQLGKQAGKQGTQIYNLRCRLTEAQSLTLMDRNSVRQLRDRSYTALVRNRDLAEENTDLRRRVAELTGDLEQARRARDTANLSAAADGLARAYGC